LSGRCPFVPHPFVPHPVVPHPVVPHPVVARRLVPCVVSALILAGIALIAPMDRARSAPKAVDTALIVSVDVSESVDEERYRLQMEGIAQALEDKAVVATILSGTNKSILFSLVSWADKSQLLVPWTFVESQADANRLAQLVRRLPRTTGEFTCLARMFTALPDLVLSTQPVPSKHIVVDVSGDGIDNCSGEAATIEARDALVARTVTVNGLPIIEDPTRLVGQGAYRSPGSPMEYLRPLESNERFTLEDWYRAYVMGGDQAFILPANGYADFARAMRQKFITEISGLEEKATTIHLIAQR
jgi:Protein of unknown function (DUF1194)